ncbi:MAG: TIGR01777 family oxidoreductase [Prolixibacteraceae bacterium]|nr:TIGR01777 family oxidoreductase [Prolixibacteraceae bacterium]
MKIALTGAGGFIGQQLIGYFTQKGNECIILDRRESIEKWKEKILAASVIVNLAGSPIFVRWNKKNKKIILESRILTTRKIVSILNSLPYDGPPKTFISASATGIYPDDKFKSYDEFSTEKGSGFLSEVVSKWEAEVDDLVNPSVRLAITRFGMVMDKNFGALALMLKIFRAGLGGRIASGRQITTFIHIKDACRAIEFIIKQKTATGIFNLTTPNPLTNNDFTRIMGKKLKRPTPLIMPGFVLKMVYGQASTIMINGSTYYPSQLLKMGFEFSYPTFENILDNLLNIKKK